MAQEKKRNVVVGRDLMNSEKYITIDGKRMKLVYSNRTYMNIERVWREVYGEKKNFSDILSEVRSGMISAMMIMFYCALQTGGNFTDVDFDEFCDTFDLAALQTIGDTALDAALESLPEDDGKKKNA